MNSSKDKPLKSKKRLNFRETNNNRSHRKDLDAMISEMMILVRAVTIHTLIGVEATVRPMMKTAIRAVIRVTNEAADAETSKLATRAGSEAAMCSKSTVAATTTQITTIAITDEERNRPHGEIRKAEVALDRIESKRLVSMTKSKTWLSSSRMLS